MDEADQNGVFLHSRNLNSEFIIKCLTMLVSDVPGINVTSVIKDEIHHGYKVYFSSPDKDVVLAKKRLIESGSGEEIRICPLTTSLTIHGVLKNAGEQIMEELLDAIRIKFGAFPLGDPVLTSVTFMKANYRVCLDVPELEELEIFNHVGYPHMIIAIPSSKELLKVTFHCRQCGGNEHTQQDCPLYDEARMNSREVPHSSTIQQSFSFDPENKDNGTNSSEYFSPTSSNIGVFPSSFRNTPGTSPRNSTTPAIRSPYFSDEDAYGYAPTTPSTTAAETDALSCFNSDFESNNFENNNGYRSFLMPSTPVEDTSILSPFLQRYINEACEESIVFNRDQFDAFLIHVKSKNPLKIARKFTHDVGGVKSLLKRITFLFYNTKQRGTKEDKQFIKRLEGLVERLDAAIEIATRE